MSLWLEEEMERRFGSREAAKRQIFARYASFIYLGNGRYGFAAASEGHPLNSRVYVFKLGGTAPRPALNLQRAPLAKPPVVAVAIE